MFNSTILIGRLTDDPKLTNYEDQYCVTNITLAVARPFKNSEGQTDTDFIKVTLWDNFARNTCEYCRKGDLVAVRARIQVRTLDLNVCDEDGEHQKKYNMLELVGERIIFLQTSGKRIDDFEDE